MPYLPFQTKTGAKVELSGNNAEAFQKAIDKRGDIAHPDLAMTFIKAFFHRRDIQVKKQKAILAEDEDAEDEAEAELGPAEAAESQAKDNYERACRGESIATSSSSASAATAASADNKEADNPYGFLKPDANDQPPEDDDFM